MLTITNRLFKKRVGFFRPHYSFSSYFSDQTRQQKQLAAKQAAQIIRFLGIVDGQQKSLNNFIPLAEEIKTKLNIRSKTINNMLDPKIGIKLPDHFLTQTRITDAFNILNPLNQKKFTFFPNRIVTCRIFQQILYQTSQKLIHGPAGSSKTVAFTFYTCLSQIINEYEFQFDEIIDQDIPRMFYLNYINNKQRYEIIQNESQLNLKKKKIQDYIVDQIKLNLPKKLSDKFNDIQSAEELTLEIKEHFIKKRKLKIKFVFDQFNKFISEVRQYNSSVSVQKNPILYFQKKKLSFQSGIWFEKASNLCNSQVFYNSSQNIQDKLLKKISQPQVSFSIYSHTPLHKGQIKFYQQIQLPEGKREMVSFFFFELKRLCLPMYLQKITQIEKKYFQNFEENLKGVSKHIIITHFQIREYLNKNKKNFKLFLSDSGIKNEVMEKIKQIINDVFKQSKNNIIDEIKNFCFKNNESASLKTKKIKFLMAVRTIIQRRLKNRDQSKRILNDKNIYQLTMQEIKKQLGVHIKMYKIGNEIIDKNLFQFQYQITQDYDKQIKIKWSPLYFLELSNIVEEALNQIIKQNSQIFTNTFFKHFRYYNADVGILFDHLITESIKKQPLQLKFQNKSTTQLFTIQKSLRFLQFNSQGLFQGFQQKFEEFITESKRYSCIAGVPETRIQQKSINRNSIDLLIFQKGVTGDYTIFTFDFTVMNSQITDKSLKFTDSIKCFQQVYENYYGRMQKQNGGTLTNKQLKLKSLDYDYRKKSKRLKITNIVHTIICNQSDYYSRTLKVKIPHKRLYGYLTVQTSNVKNFGIQFSDMRSKLSAQNSSIFQRIINQLKKMKRF